MSHPPNQDIRIEVKDFGPVAEGSISLRPLTVFVGPSNTGKTYLAILIYALHRVFGGFSRVPLQRNLPYDFFRLPLARTPVEERPISEEALRQVIEKLLDIERRPFKFPDLPDSLSEAVESSLNDPNAFGAELEAELRRCFDLESASEMIRRPLRKKTTISLKLTGNTGDLWQFAMDASKGGTTVRGQIEDMVLLHGASAAKRVERNSRLGGVLSLAKAGRTHPFVLQVLLDLLAEDRITCYLPAVRSGIMQSHRMIASALVNRSTRAGFESYPQIPTFSGGVADFMQRLILYDEKRDRSERMSGMAAALETETLAGRILATRSAAGGYPEFIYRPQEAKQEIRLTRASSMVSELAPIVLFLRSIVRPGDTFIIEEPEAHLHPAAQTQMAMTLARLVRAGVNVVVTTHSDWLLHELANLMREGEIGDSLNGLSDGDPLAAWLNPKEVGIWLFGRGDDIAGSTIKEVPFDRVEGVEPWDYQEVAEALYNRSAELQNQLAEAEKKERRRHE